MTHLTARRSARPNPNDVAPCAARSRPEIDAAIAVCSHVRLNGLREHPLLGVDNRAGCSIRPPNGDPVVDVVESLEGPMNTEMTPETVAQDMFTVLHGQPAPVVTRWTYSTADPFAVTLGVRG